MKTNNTISTEFLTTTQLCELLHISVQTLWRFKQNFPQPIRVGRGKNIYRRSDIDKWAETQLKKSNSLPLA